MEAKEKLSFKEWCEHAWYYYKWLIIFGGLVVIFLVSAFIQMLIKPEPDVHILYTGKATASVKGVSELTKTVENLIEDYNNDGKKKCDYIDITALSEEESGVVFNADINAAAIKRFETEIRAGDSIIFLLNEYYFKEALDLGVLAKLSDVLDSTAMPQTTYNEYGVYLKDLDLYKAPGFNQLPGNTVVCIRRSPENDELKYQRTIEAYTANKLCFQKLITYKAAGEEQSH
jgi:hypothetical protein